MANSKFGYWTIALGGLIVLAGISTFTLGMDDNGKQRIGCNSMIHYPAYPINDSVPGKGKSGQEEKLKKSEKDFDFEMDGFDKSMREFEIEMKKLGEEFSSEKWEKAEREMERAMKDIDMEKIMMKTQKAFDKIDWQKMNDEINLSIKSVDWSQFDKSFEIAKEQMEKNKEFMKMNWEKTWKEGMENAKRGIDKAKIEMKRLQDFINDLQKDGLIKKGESFTIELKHGALIINGKEQPKQVTDKYKNSEKYRSYFEKDKDWKIKSDGRHNEWDDDDVI